MLAELRQSIAIPMRLEAVLKGVAGHTGSGAVRYEEHKDGRRRLKADIAGVAGLSVEIVVNGALLATLACRDGRAARRFDSAAGAAVPALRPGDRVEIRQNGDFIFTGTLKALNSRMRAQAQQSPPVCFGGHRTSP
ncbi:MAG: hypothetical protein ACK4NP_12950 [Parvularculaceae bacterium]